MRSFNKKKWLFISAVLLCFFLFKIGLSQWHEKQHKPAINVPIQACQVDQAGCPFAHRANFRLEGVLDHRTPFNIVVTGLPHSIQKVSVSFVMQGMDMGFNRIDLVKQKDDTWLAHKVYLPLCTAARHDWIVQWFVDGEMFQAPFTTKK